ncbi:hypothetical protein HPP92_019719 [Vanilla planifolia]|uniref:Uncharacterized protein n=2 Tax=Vanilla planifolia TaxID=51239 RepID=A0A835Q7A5_VANPL|nr:hypothetical protein HPP92_019719 [Vanilla planifolia]
MAFIVGFFTILRSLTRNLANKLPATASEVDNGCSPFCLDPVMEGSPCSPVPVIRGANLHSSLLRRIGELEEKVDNLQTKQTEMPLKKEELLDAAVRRVDALEAELIATKKALYEALMRQDELLAYVDRQQQAKRKKRVFCF